ncbi:MAG: SIMPL domain-containing protein [Spirochaetaceae bacterium]|nr:SIMPL domain-containing protein [Spirochaetaceae bacterium]
MNFKVIFNNVLMFVFSIFAIGCNTLKDNQGIISVSGIGTVMASPDMVQIHLYFKNVSPTTEQARNAVSTSVQNALGILKEENIIDNNIKTISLGYGVENQYKDGTMVYVGQRAEQTIIVTIDDIKNNSKKLSAILDKMVLIDNISIRDIRFDIKEKVELFRQSRELAFQKTLDKAEQYASLSGKRITGVQNISESNNRNTILSQSNTMYSRAVSSSDGYSNIPTGELEITTEIKVEYKIE